jgi:glc operon protein GlcG
MQSKPVLTVVEATRILEAARAEAEKNQWAVTIAVVDDGGHLLSLLRLDGCAPIGAYIATEKARTSALGRRSSTKT